MNLCFQSLIFNSNCDLTYYIKGSGRWWEDEMSKYSSISNSKLFIDTVGIIQITANANKSKKLEMHWLAYQNTYFCIKRQK